MSKGKENKTKDGKPTKEERAYSKELKRCLERLSTFIQPIEEHWSGIGLATLFVWLAARTGAGIIITAPMGAGKSLVVKIVEWLMEASGFADYVFNIQEFKKTDWKEILPEYANDKFFFFSIPEISVMLKYSQELFLPKISTLQSDGDFEYRFPSAGDDEGGSIIFENCQAGYAIASQPPKTYAIINDETFKTLANDRCWNIILINQLRGSENVPLKDIDKHCSKIDLEDGNYVRLKIKRTAAFKRLPKVLNTIIDGKTYLDIDRAYIRFDNGRQWKNQSYHLTKSTLNTDKFVEIIRNQYSVNRRYQQMNDILKEWAAFLNVVTVKQVHIDLFLSLFGFYVKLFNSLTIGNVEKSIDFKYGATEMLCRISDLKSQGEIVTQHLLTLEFNTEEDDISKHISELIKASIIQEYKPKTRKKVPRSHRKKDVRSIYRQTNILRSVGLLSKRFATKDDSKGNPNVSPREAIYDFTDDINDHFVLYANILNDMLDWTTLITIPHISRYLAMRKKSKEEI